MSGQQVGCPGALRPGKLISTLSCSENWALQVPAPVEVLPKAGLVVSERGNLTEVLCKPKIMPLKSVTLEHIEQMEVGQYRYCTGCLKIYVLGCSESPAGQTLGGERKGCCRGSKQRTYILTWQPCSWTLAAPIS